MYSCQNKRRTNRASFRGLYDYFCDVLGEVSVEELANNKKLASQAGTILEILSEQGAGNELC